MLFSLCPTESFTEQQLATLLEQVGALSAQTRDVIPLLLDVRVASPSMCLLYAVLNDALRSE